MMPELPEVETVRRVLEKQIVNHRIYEVTVKQNSTIAHPEPSILASSLKNQMISSLSRRGKFLIKREVALDGFQRGAHSSRLVIVVDVIL